MIRLLPILRFALIAFLSCVMLAQAVAQESGGGQNHNEDAASFEPVEQLEVLPKIFRGTLAQPGQFPFHAAIGLRLWSGGPHRYHCGASLIAPRWLVSARHCFKRRPDGGLYKAAIATLEHAGFSDAIPVEEIYSYRRTADEAGYLADIVLILLASDAPARAVVLPLQDETGFREARHEAGNTPYTILGFGETISGGGATSELQFAKDIPSVPSDLCRTIDIQPENELVFGDRVVADTICAGDQNNPLGSDACKGDSGGGLIYFPEPDRPVLAGIVTGGTKVNDFGCNTHRIKIGLYTRVASYRDQLALCIASIEDPECRFKPLLASEE